MDSLVVFIELSVPRKNRYICDITEKLYEEGKQIHIYATQKDAVLQLSRDLWIWKPDSFVPHGVYFGKEQSTLPDEPVIVTSILPDQRADVLILHDPLPLEKIKGYSQIIDFAEIYEKQKHVDSRKRFKAFRDSSGFNVMFTKIGVFLGQKHSLSKNDV